MLSLGVVSAVAAQQAPQPTPRLRAVLADSGARPLIGTFIRADTAGTWLRMDRKPHDTLAITPRIVATWEQSMGRRPRRGRSARIGAMVGSAFFASTTALYLGSEMEARDVVLAGVWGGGVGALVGLGWAALTGRERWEPIPPPSL